MEESIVKVSWQDTSHYDDEDLSQALREEVAIFESLGFLLDKSDQRILIASSRCSDGDYKGILLIPHACIIKIQEVKI